MKNEKVWRVDFLNGHALFGSEKRAMEIYDDPDWEAIDINRCAGSFDEHWHIDAMPDYDELVIDFLRIMPYDFNNG